MRGHDYECRFDARLFDLLEDGESIDVRKLDVQEGDIVEIFLQRLSGRSAVGEGLDPVPFIFQGFFQNEAKRFFVLGDQDLSLFHNQLIQIGSIVRLNTMQNEDCKVKKSKPLV